MKVSIVTAVFNREDTIAEAIQSVQRQSHPDVEHILVDGASSDGTLDEVHRVADDRIRVISEPDQGIYDALNKGIYHASGDVVGLMHSDDFFASSDIIETVVDAFQEQDIDGVYGDLEYVSAKDSSQVIRYWSAGGYAPEKLRYGWMPPHPTLYLRRSVLEDLGGYDIDYRIAADYEAMLRWFVRGNVRLAYVPKVFVRMRVGGASNQSIAHIVRKSREDYRALRKHGVGGVGALIMKNLRKFKQFLVRRTPS